MIFMPILIHQEEDRAAVETEYGLRVFEKCRPLFDKIPSRVRLTGSARFSVPSEKADAMVALVESDLLCKARAAMVELIPGAIRRHQFTPHVTLLYIGQHVAQPAVHVQSEVTINRVVVARTGGVIIAQAEIKPPPEEST
jgi:hypothetical protein